MIISPIKPCIFCGGNLYGPPFPLDEQGRMELRRVWGLPDAFDPEKFHAALHRLEQMGWASELEAGR